MIWLILLLIMAMTGVAGYYQGAIRAAMSSIGLVVALALAHPLSGAVKPLVKLGGIQQPVAQQTLAHLIAFAVVLIAFKVAAQTINYKVNYHFEYKGTESLKLRWERFHPRVGACVGLFNGAVYFLVLMIPIYVFGYVAAEVSSEGDPKPWTLLSQARHELHDTKFDKVVASRDPASPEFYELADTVALIAKNPLLESRLSRYPSLLTLSERTEFQNIANDVEFHNLWQGGAKFSELLKHPKVQAIATNQILVAEIQRLVQADLKDFHKFLETGESEKYDSEKILGRWHIDLAEVIEMGKQEKRNMQPPEVLRLRQRAAPFTGATLVATTENRVLLKRGENAPNAQNQPKTMAEGTWSKEGVGYKITFDNKSEDALIDEDKMLLPKDGLTLVFEKEM